MRECKILKWDIDKNDGCDFAAVVNPYLTQGWTISGFSCDRFHYMYVLLTR